MDELPTVVSTGQADWKGSAQRNRASVAYMAEAQGIDPARFEKTPFTTTELRRAIANGVPPINHSHSYSIQAHQP